MKDIKSYSRINNVSTLAIYDINSYISNHPDIIAFLGKTINIFPDIGYADEKSPYIVYMYAPSIPDIESFWYRTDHLAYLIYDTDIDRAFQIAEILINIMGKGDEIAQPNGAIGSDYRILSSKLVAAVSSGPQERDGWYRMDIEFEIHHVKR